MLWLSLLYSSCAALVWAELSDCALPATAQSGRGAGTNNRLLTLLKSETRPSGLGPQVTPCLKAEMLCRRE